MNKPREQYLQKMKNANTFGDHLTLLALAEIFHVTIRVYSDWEEQPFDFVPTVVRDYPVLLLAHHPPLYFVPLLLVEGNSNVTNNHNDKHPSPLPTSTTTTSTITPTAMAIPLLSKAISISIYQSIDK
jgi:hypothetical protein